MRNYYYVGTLLPTLSFETPPEITFSELEVLLRDNLTPNDYEKTLVIRSYYDMMNLRSLWLEEELDPKGFLSSSELEEALVNRIGLPGYVFEFIDKYPKMDDRIHHFPLLLAIFFQQAETLQDRFLREYLRFERELRLVMTAFRAKKLGRNLQVELQYENPEEELIAQLLAQQDSEEYEPPEKYKDLKVIFDKWGNDPMALQKALDEYRFQKIGSLIDFADAFSTDRILAYFTKYLLLEKWFDLDKVKGNKIVDAIAKENGHGTNG